MTGDAAKIEPQVVVALVALTGVDDLLTGERLRRAAAPMPDEREILGAEHCDHPGRLKCRRGVDRRDGRVGLVGEHQPRVEKPLNR